jgi:2,4-dienoyl-CoA reductase-like NADH-dependent reductase (Old Yellow Enzyme family)/NADPH-dependent 2,4-dienoyl-CoA reductase/sulfur reductase-like enzyme
MHVYPSLFEPIRVGSVLFRNRIFASATGAADIQPDKSLPDRTLLYYARKAMGGAAQVTVGECQVDHPGGGSRGGVCVDLSDFRSMMWLSRLSDGISRHGAAASAELCHAGRYSFTGYGPSDGEVDPGKPCHAMSEEKILSTITAYANAARLAKMSGFGMVTVHGGHGWLPQQFFSPFYNFRTDRWGGSAENRARFAVAVCDAIHDACGRDFPVEIRISGTELQDGYDLDGGIEYARFLDGHADIIHVSVGVHGSLSNDHWLATCPTMFKEDGINVKYAAEIKKHVKTSLITTVGSLSDPLMMEEIIASGKADFVALARELLCDPDLPNKARDGRSSDIRQCLRCMNCWSNLMSGFYCALNPETGREVETLSALPAAAPKRVLVVGGGIAGMQAALSASANGHDVTLCEKLERLGGGIICEEKVPFKKHVADYIALQESLIHKAPITLKLGTEVTSGLAKALRPDVIIAAVGGTPLVPPIEGIEYALGANAVYSTPGLAGQRVVIIGAGLVGAELAVYLKRLGRDIELLEQAPELNAEGNRIHGMAIAAEFRELGITPRFGAKVTRISPKSVESTQGSFEADTVVYATGQKPNTDAVTALSVLAPRFYAVGDCTGVGNIMNATKSAWTVARDIGRF